MKQTEEPTHTGEGFTRTTDPAARLWPVTVTFVTGARPLHTTIRAVSANQAADFARNRHPYSRTVAVGRKSE